MTAHLSFGISGSIDSVEFLYNQTLEIILWLHLWSAKLHQTSWEAKFELQKFSHENNLTSLQNFQHLFRFFLSRRKLIANKQAKVNKKGGMFEKLGVKILQQLSDQVKPSSAQAFRFCISCHCCFWMTRFLMLECDEWLRVNGWMLSSYSLLARSLV